MAMRLNVDGECGQILHIDGVCAAPGSWQIAPSLMLADGEGTLYWVRALHTKGALW